MNNLRKLTGTDTDEVFIDTDRQIAINARQMTTEQHYRYYKSSFNTMRPDLTEWEYEAWAKRYIIGEQYLNSMRTFLNYESSRISNLYPICARADKILNYEQQIYQLRAPFIVGPRASANRNWVDATKVVNYLEKQLQKMIKYGLDYPNHYVPQSAQELQQREDEVYERFIREMRKPPVVATQ